MEGTPNLWDMSNAINQASPHQEHHHINPPNKGYTAGTYINHPFHLSWRKRSTRFHHVCATVVSDGSPCHFTHLLLTPTLAIFYRNGVTFIQPSHCIDH